MLDWHRHEMNVLQVLHWESYLLTGEFTTVS